MKNSKVLITEIYWERVQLFIVGKVENVDLKNTKFMLRNLTETKTFYAHSTKVEGNNFECRFNVAILDNGNYLPSGDYMFIGFCENLIVADIDNGLLQDPDELDEIDLEVYENFETSTEKLNFLLRDYSKQFKKGGNSKKNIYSVIPQISREVNEFIIKVNYRKPREPISKLKQKVIDKYMSIRKTLFNIRKFFFQLIFRLGKYSKLRRGNDVLFTSDSRAEMSGNFEFIYNKMIERNIHEKYKIRTIFKPHISERRSLIDKFRFPYLLGKSDYIFVDDFHPLIYTVKLRPNQELIQVWHACGAFKTVGYSRAGKKGGPFFDSLIHRNYTKATVSSETDIPFYAEAFGIKEENILPTGVPRTDIFFDENYEKKIVDELENELPIINNKKVILFAPTFRGSGANTAHYPFFKIDLDKFAKYCEDNNAIVLFKMHPFVKNKLAIPNEYNKYFKDISDFREVNDILFVTDVLITDYSSLIYEFSTFNRSMLFYAFDLEDYIATRDFYEPYESFVPGKIVTTFDELIYSLNNEDFEHEKVKPFLNKHFKYQDGQSSERIVRRIFR